MPEVVLAHRSYGTANTPFVHSSRRLDTGWTVTSSEPVLLVTAYEPRRVTIDWLAQAPHSKMEEVGEEQLTKIIDGLQQLVAARAFTVLAKLMRTFKPEDLPPATSVALLRLTYPARREIDSWQTFLRRTRVTLRQSGLDAASLLQGLG